MVVKLLIKILLGLCLSLVSQAQAKTHIGKILGEAKTYLQGTDLGPRNFENWTQEVNLSLKVDQQQQLAWSVPWEEILTGGLPLSDMLEMQKKLSPTNPLKLRLWISFYWFLRRSNGLDPNLVAKFASKLKQLRRNNTNCCNLWDRDLQNMWQSLPKSLRVMLQSRWLCLQNKKHMVYIVSGYKLDLGANSICSMWQLEEENADQWLRLTNFCDKKNEFFLDIVKQSSNQGSLQQIPSVTAMNFCVFNNFAYFREASELDASCHWQINDCSHLPRILRAKINN